MKFFGKSWFREKRDIRDMTRVYRLFIDDGGQSAIFKSREAAETEGVMYAEGFPQALVMLVELDMAECRFCDEAIIQVAGAVLHKWQHLRTGTYLCFMKMLQAEPKEE